MAEAGARRGRREGKLGAPDAAAAVERLVPCTTLRDLAGGLHPRLEHLGASRAPQAGTRAGGDDHLTPRMLLAFR